MLTRAGQPDQLGHKKRNFIPGLKSAFLVISSGFGGHGGSSVLVEIASSGVQVKELLCFLDVFESSWFCQVKFE